MRDRIRVWQPFTQRELRGIVQCVIAAGVVLTTGLMIICINQGWL